jgi:hypothetical protein
VSVVVFILRFAFAVMRFSANDKTEASQAAKAESSTAHSITGTPHLQSGVHARGNIDLMRHDKMRMNAKTGLMNAEASPNAVIR